MQIIRIAFILLPIIMVIENLLPGPEEEYPEEESGPVLVFEFGIQNKIEIYRDSSSYHILIFDNSRLLSVENIDTSAILNKAVTTLPNELKESDFIIRHDYTPLFYKMTFYPCDDNNKVVIDWTMYLSEDSILRNDIIRLRQFLIERWSLNILSDHIK